MLLSSVSNRALAVLVAALVIAAAPLAAEPYPAPIRHLQAEGVEIVDSSDDGELPLYIGKYQGRLMEIYLTPDEQHAIIGTMINAQGEQVAADKLRAAAPDALDWESLEKTHWIVEGDPNGERIVYAFMDPNCPYCGAFWKASRKYIDRPGIQLRFIMVGFLRPSSEGLAANILAAENPAAALAEHEMNRDKGVAAEPKPVVSRFVRMVQENTAFMTTNEIYATPTVVFKNRLGKVQLIQGLPNETVMDQEIFAR